MRQLEHARSLIGKRPDGDAERTLHRVIVALETNTAIDVAGIYALDYDSFKLVLDIIDGWWLQRYTGVARNGVADAIPFIEKRDNGI